MSQLVSLTTGDCIVSPGTGRDAENLVRKLKRKFEEELEEEENTAMQPRSNREMRERGRRRTHYLEQQRCIPLRKTQEICKVLNKK